MRPEPAEDRPSWLVEDDSPAHVAESIVLGGQVEPNPEASADRPRQSAIDRIGPVPIIGGAIFVGTLIAFAISGYTSLGQPAPVEPPPTQTVYDPGSVPVHKGIRKSNPK